VQAVSPPAGAPPESAATYATGLAADRPADFDYTRASEEVGSANPLAGGAAMPGPAAPPALSEPVYIIRGGSAAGEVILVEHPSPAFLEQLAREAQAPISGGVQLPANVRAVVETTGSAPAAAGPLVRGQSPGRLPVASAPGHRPLR
jgi:hypothetical protein